MARLDRYLGLMKERLASDLHFKVGIRPRFRVDGDLEEYDTDLPVDTAIVDSMMSELIAPEARKRFAQMEEIDFSYNSSGFGFFRVSYYRDHRGSCASIRRIPDEIPTIPSLNLPESIESFAHFRNGLVLMTGPTGCGKSSTLAALMNIINHNFNKHIITLEDPIEYVYSNDRCIVHQRGLHDHFRTFEEGMTAALSEDPDVLLVGELRDLETIRLTLAAAETGMLVFATLHTVGAAQSIDRIYDVYPAGEQAEIRTLLSQCLEGVISQVLLKRLDQSGRVPAVEVLLCTSAVRNLIREGKTMEINNLIQGGKSIGMMTMVESLERLCIQGKISIDEAVTYCPNRERLEKRVQSYGSGGSKSGS